MRSFIFGKSALGMAIPAFQFGPENTKKHCLILGGVHGDEIEGSTAVYGLLGELEKSYPFEMKTTLVPTFNIDGTLSKTRVNGNGVDLNRNLPTNDWDPKAFNDRYPPGPEANSEPENQSLVKFLESQPATFVISVHSYVKTMLNINGDCEPEATILNKETGYEIKKEMGYPTPGCLGTYAGLERNMPTITYEILRDLPLKEVLAIHVPAILKAMVEINKRS